MIILLILNEVKNSLLSLRFVIGLLFVLIVCTGGSLIFCRKYLDEKEKDSFNNQQTDSDLESNAHQGLESLYDGVFRCVKQQDLSSFFASGNEARIPKSMVICPRAPQGASTSGGMIVSSGGRNYKIENYTDFDCTFIVGVVLSFLAIILGFDAVSRDRENGTLKQQLSNAVPRVSILFGKFAAIMVLLSITILIGSLLSTVLFQAVLGRTVLTAFPAASLLSVVLSILYLAMFVWLSLWISASSARSTTSLALLLLAWMFLVVLSPYVGGMLAQQYSPIPSNEQHDRNFQMTINAEPYPPAFGDFYHGRGREEDWSIVDQFCQRQDDRFEQLVNQRFNELTAQSLKGEQFNSISPYGAFRQTMERIANTGLAYHVKFFQAARRYRSEMLQFVREQDRLDPQSGHHIASLRQIRSISNKPVDPAIVPRFIAPSRAVAFDDLIATLPAAGYILILNVVFFFAALVMFLRMDVR
jgi:ABC-type transport system involved in multi-copper enzyme maturation permease subunit